jgi:hypothetical protein
MVEALKVNVITDSEYNGFNIDVLSSTLERVKTFSSEFDFLVDVYIFADDEFISVDDAIYLCRKDIRLTFPMSDYNDITIIIY